MGPLWGNTHKISSDVLPFRFGDSFKEALVDITPQLGCVWVLAFTYSVKEVAPGLTTQRATAIRNAAVLVHPLSSREFVKG